MLVRAPIYGIEEHRLEFLSDRPALTRSNKTTVEFANRCDFSSRAGEKSFVANIDIVTREPPGFDFQSDFARESYECVPGNTDQCGREFRFVQLVVFHDEQVFAEYVQKEIRQIIDARSPGGSEGSVNSDLDIPVPGGTF